MLSEDEVTPMPGGNGKEQSPCVVLATLSMLLMYGLTGRFDPLEEEVVIVAQTSFKS